MVNDKETISKASKGMIEKFYNSSKQLSKSESAFGVMPEFSREKALAAVRKDATVMAALNTLVDKSLAHGYRVIGKDGKSKAGPLSKELEGLRFKKLLRQIFYNLYAYNNVFVEIVKNPKGGVKELHVLETTHTEPVADEHGKVLFYQQVIPDAKPSTYPTWTPEEVTHMTVTKLTTGIWGEIDLEAVYTSVLLKQYIYAFLGWLYGTNQFKGFFNIEDANDDQVKEFLSFLKRSQDSIETPIIARGKIQHQVLRDFKDGDTVLSLLNKCDANILMLMQVPPITIGLPGDSNRSNSDAQERSLATRISSIQDVVEDDTKYDLFPKMGYDKSSIVFEPVESVDIEKLLENAERMKTIGFKSSVIEQFVKDKGFPIDGPLIDEDIFASAVSSGKSDDMYPSRKGKLDGDSSKKIGSGEAGSTRSDQLVSKGASGWYFDLYDDDLTEVLPFVSKGLTKWDYNDNNVDERSSWAYEEDK